MNKLAAACLVVAFAMMPSPAGSQQDAKPPEVAAADALGQIQTLIETDETAKRPAADTLSMVKQIVSLNSMQISIADVDPAFGARLDGPGFVLESQKVAFKELRASICQARPDLKIVNSNGQLEPCH
ncbi:MAG TPA: hypothetical protein VJO53_02775 [Candidatus Acidoferrales bacterium]|nr:hypothetical protein [Candidatus Acidoferrales bacterium]